MEGLVSKRGVLLHQARGRCQGHRTEYGGKRNSPTWENRGSDQGTSTGRMADQGVTGGKVMFSVKEKRHISEQIQKILRETNHAELPDTEIKFHIHVWGAEGWSWADIMNNGAIDSPSENPFNEMQAP